MSDLNIDNACSVSKSEPIGTTSLAAAACNLSYLDMISNSNLESATNRVGESTPTVKESLRRISINAAGTFGVATTLVSPNDAMLQTGVGYWYWVGEFPKAVLANEIPTSPNWVLATVNDHESLVNTNYDGAHNSASISRGAETVEESLTSIEEDISTLQTGQGSGVIAYATRALLDSDLAHNEGDVGYVTNDLTIANNGVYRKVGDTGVGSWAQSSGTIPNQSITRLQLSKSFSFNGQIPASTDLDSLRDDGNYYGQASGSYLNLPDDFGTDNFNLYVNEGFDGSSNFIFQRVSNFNNPLLTWSRRIGSPWVNTYQSDRMLTRGTYGDGLSLRLANKDGNYFLSSANSYLDMPTDAPSADYILKVNEAFLTNPGVFVQQRLESSANPNIAWVRRINSTASDGQPWVKSTSANAATGREQLTDYFDGGADITSGSADDVIKSGVYLVLDANSVAGLPVGASSGILEVRQNDDGGWGYQEYTDLLQAKLKQRRMIRSGFAPQSWQGLPASESVIACFGDSITENGTYPQQLAQMIGGKVLRMGFGGCRMANHEDSGYNAMCMNNISDDIAAGDYTDLIAGAEQVFQNQGDDNRVQAALVRDTDWSTVDYVILFWGTNDYAADIPLGTITDNDGTTFLGAINKTVTNLLTAYPNLKILIVTPFWRPRILAGDGKESDTFPNGNGDFLIDFADALIERGNNYHLDSFDFYRTGGIGPLTQHQYLGAGDDIHPVNPGGYTHVAERIAAAFRAKFR